MESGWDEAADQYREIVQIGAVRVTPLGDGVEVVDTFETLVRPRINPELSAYFVDLTGITQSAVDDRGVDFPHAWAEFGEWCGDRPRFSWGNDLGVVRDNVTLYDLRVDPDASSYFDVRPVFALFGVPVEEYTSGRVHEYFGVDAAVDRHDAAEDARSMALALRAAVEG